MHRIDSTNAVNGAFVAGNPVTGTRPTFVTAAWHNTIQEELANVVTAAGITLDKTNNAQLLQALNVLINNALSTALTAAIPGIVQQVIAAVGAGGGSGTVSCQQVASILTQYGTITNGVLEINCPTDGGGDGGGGQTGAVSVASGTLTLTITGDAAYESGELTITDPIDGAQTYQIIGNELTITE